MGPERGSSTRGRARPRFDCARSDDYLDERRAVLAPGSGSPGSDKLLHIRPWISIIRASLEFVRREVLETESIEGADSSVDSAQWLEVILSDIGVNL